uniref:Uncharacterized protein n=1 Tax=Anopheles dirus TaxID=7168 RepID=A0A182NX51_9DIPT
MSTAKTRRARRETSAREFDKE